MVGEYEHFLRPRRELMLLARNPLERAAAVVLNSMNIPRLSQCFDHSQRAFLFRCFYVPVYSAIAIEFATGQLHVTPLEMHEYAEHLLAMERMLLELIFLRGLGRLRRNSQQSVLDLFSSPPGGYRAWMRRFDEWRFSIRSSYRLYIRKQAPDVRRGGVRGRAAYLGNMMSRKGTLPLDLFAKAIRDIELDQARFAIVTKNALKPKPAKWSEPALDTWLIEIWPLVLAYAWTYYDVWQVTVLNWENDRPGRESLDSVPRIEDRCKKMLKLRLSPGGGARGGRPKKLGLLEGTPMPPLALAALSIQSIGMTKDDWVFGQFGFVRKQP